MLYNLEEKLVSYCMMMERNFWGLTTKSIKGRAFEPAIKMALSVHSPYNREEQAGSGSVNLCAAILDCGCASPKLLRQQE